MDNTTKCRITGRRCFLQLRRVIRRADETWISDYIKCGINEIQPDCKRHEKCAYAARIRNSAQYQTNRKIKCKHGVFRIVSNNYCSVYANKEHSDKMVYQSQAFSFLKPRAYHAALEYGDTNNREIDVQ